MSVAEQIIRQALACDIVLYLKEDRLAFTAIGKVFPDTLRERIVEHKDIIIDYLKKLERIPNARKTQLPKIIPRLTEAQLPLSFAQQRLWFLTQLEGVSATYHIPVALRLRGSLDKEALRRALDTVFARHEALRTIFVAVDGQPHVELLPAQQPFPLVERDLLDHADPAAALAQFSREEVLTIFDLTRGPLIRASLLRLAEFDHVLLITQHHIISDGWSLGILVKEFSALYAALTQGHSDPLPPLAVQYPDYAAWQREWFTEERLAEQLSYWHRTLADAPVLLTLPTDRPRSVSPSYSGAIVPIHVDAELTRALKQLSQEHGITLFMTLMAAWAAVLARLSGQDDLVIGTPSANRGRHEIEPLVGFFVNTLALRIDLSSEPSVAELLDRIRTITLTAQDHQDVPFEQVVERINPPRRLEHTPLFQVMFAWQNNDLGTLDLPGLQVEPVTGTFDQIRFDLELNLFEVDGTIQGSLGYATDLFDAATIERQRGYLLTFLRTMVEQTNQPLTQIDLLASEERALLLRTWNQTDTPYPVDRCIHQLFEEQAQRNPDATALVFENQFLSYGELNVQANRLAQYLIEQGVRPDALVAICVERSLAMVIGLLAVLKAGGAYVPLDPEHPMERLAQILADADPAIILSDAKGHTALGEATLHKRLVLDLDHPEPVWCDYSAANPDPFALGLTPHHLAYVIYTSGSTGMPKGVMVEHRQIVSSSFARLCYYSYTPSLLPPPSIAFDAFAGSIIYALISSSLLVICPNGFGYTPKSIKEIIDLNNIETWIVNPSFYNAILDSDVGMSASLQRVIMGGQEIPSNLLRKHISQVHHQPMLYNEYGPTETTVWSTVVKLDSGIQGNCIGRPIANTRIYLLDAHQQPVPLGAVGELYIGGAGVARGYLHRPDLTAERFLPDPFSPHPKARMYRSGDLARYLPDGNLIFLGRNDHQVKLRGFRIELGEIEARLTEHPTVREAVVLPFGNDLNKHLVAYVVPTTDEHGDLSDIGHEPDNLVATLRSYLVSHLPDYMVPAAFVTLEALPLTPNGKLDRKALPSPDSDSFAHHSYEPPQGETEIILSTLWQELLGLECVGRHDNFFELGGHSLLATRLLSRLESTFGIELPLIELFTHPTLSALAVMVIQYQATDSTHLIPITPTSRDGALPLSFAQQRLWFLTQLESVSATYHIPVALRLRGSLDKEALRRALDTVFARHEALRTIFVAVDGQPHVELLPAQQPFPLVERDLLDHADPAAALAQFSREEVLTIFDLTRGPLIRASLLRLAEFDHVLLITQHHIISDGWSLGILVKEFSALYAALTQGHSDPLPPLAVQYPDYAAWQREWFTEERLAEQLSYWHRTLADAPVLLTLPTDRPRSVSPSYSGAIVPIHVDAELTRALKQLSQEHGITLFMTLMAAWAAVLARLSGQDDLVIGTPSANRGRHEIEPLVGFFVNTLALRIDLSSEPSVAELLDRIRTITLTAQDHQDVPFEQVVERINPPRRLEHTPLFQVMFAWQNNDLGTLDLPGLQVEPVTGTFDQIRFDLELNLFEVDGTIQGSLGYATDLFDAATIERQRGYLLTFLRTMVEQTNQPLTQIDLLASEERALLLRTWNQTDTPYPVDRCIHQLFEEQAQRNPDATALVFENQFLSYGELNVQANRLAQYLIEQGVRPDALVAICVERSLAMVIGLLAVLKAGGAYVPLDPEHPMERLAQILADADPAIILSDAKGHTALGEATLHKRLVLDLDHPEPVWCDYSAANPDPFALGLTPHHLAYVIYTSGSTGMPKGVQNEHSAVVNRLTWMQKAYCLTENDVILQKTPYTFDVSVWEFFWPLLNGATLLIAEPDGHRDPRYLVDVIVRNDVTVMHFVPSMLNAFLHAEDTSRCTSLRHIVCSGEALPAASVNMCRRRLPWAHLYNLYGPTEAAIDVTAWTCPDDFNDDLVPIGRPIANTRIYLLDAHQQPVPLGAVGELYIGGAGVARGYLHRPDLTAERFLPDPFSPHPKARMYRSGDLARYLPDGNLIFLGRNDHQVKLRGFRIELGEIEARLTEHPTVREAVVLPFGNDLNKHLVAYVVPTTDEHGDLSDIGHEPDNLVATLRSYLVSHLPDYMVPAAFVTLEALPLTPNGKLDRKALPSPDSDSFAHHSYEPPQGETEIILSTLWQELLGLECVGRHDNFFELGGHSLLATRLLSRLESTFGIELPLIELFTHPTLSALAVMVIQYQATDSTHLIPITPTSRDGALPLSFAQQRLWFLTQLESVSATYHIPVALRLRGSLDKEALRRALDTVFARHEALRTIFVAVDGQPHVELLPAQQPFPLVERDLLDHADPAAALAQFSREEVLTIFDLTRGPLIRASLLRLAEFDHVLLITQHHIISDGWSLGILVKEFSALYAALTQGHSDPLPPLAVQYPDYAAWQREWFTEERLAEQLSYWHRTLADAPVLLTLPTDRPRSVSPSYSGAIVPIHVDAELTRALKQLSQEHGITLFMTLMAAWAAVLARLSGQDDLVIGTPSANRGRHEIEPLVGFFVNTLALRIDLSSEPSVAELLDRIRTITLTAQDHQDVPFEQVVERINPPRRLEHTPLFQVMFAWQNNDLGTLDLPGLQVEPVTGTFDQIRFDLELNLFEVDGTIQGSLGYATDLFDAATIERQRGYLLTFLRTMVEQTNQPLTQIDLLASEERALLLRTWNQTDTPYPVDRCIHQLFEEQAQRNPDATALVFENQFLSYGELNVQANRLAQYLIEQGVRPDALVAICVERSLAMVIGLLAVLKAGGAYVPLDPEHPMERLAQILADADPAIILSDAKGHTALGEATLHKRLVLDLDHPEPVWCDYSAANPDPFALGLTPHHLAYVIYTSGSTGMPKGVMVEHAQVSRLFEATQDLYKFNAQDRWCLFHSYAFDFSVWELWGALRYGGRLILVPSEIVRLPSAFYQLVCTQGITILNQTPSAFRGFIEAQAHDPQHHQLRYVIFGGEALKPTILKAWYARYGDTMPQLVNMYGITETTVHVTYKAMERGDTDLLESPIGQRLPDLCIYLLDAHQQPVPLGAVGELYIGGAGVARGYLHRPDLTAERFLPDPFSPHPKARMYRSGDLARYLPDGNLIFLGRNDHQVKLRGFRIELGEIEARLTEHPTVREAVVLPFGNDLNKHLVAYVVPTTDEHGDLSDIGHEPDNLVATLRSYLVSHLPDYMVPAAFVTLEALPLTPNGKLDRKALPSPTDTDIRQNVYSPPRNNFESILCEIWQKVLGLKQIGIHDNYFENGGNSLQTIQIIFEARKIGLELTVGQFFKHPTIASLVESLAADLGKTKDLQHVEEVDNCAYQPCDSSDVLITELHVDNGFTETHLRHLIKKLYRSYPQLINRHKHEMLNRHILDQATSSKGIIYVAESHAVSVSGDMCRCISSLQGSLFLASLLPIDDIMSCLYLAIHPCLVNELEWKGIVKLSSAYCSSRNRNADIRRTEAAGLNSEHK